jgi:F1F0 ATPase subunit 2
VVDAMSVMMIVTSAFAGAALGWLFFGLLWLTVRLLPTARRPALLAGVSYPARLLLLAGGLWLISAGDPWRLLAALLGLLIARSVFLRRVAVDMQPVRTRSGER